MERRQLGLELNTGRSAEELQEIVKLLSKMNEKLDGVADNGKAIESVGKGAKKSVGGIKAMFKNLTSVGNLFKASGVFFLATKIMEGLQQAFSENQVVLDAFKVAGTAATQVITDFTTFVINNFGKVQEFFGAVFSDPIQSIQNLGKAIKQGFIDRFEQAKEVLGLVSDAAVKFFKGDFSGAVDSLKEAGKESVDVITGQDKSLDKVKETIKGVVDATVNYAKSTYDAAKNVVELNKEAAIAEAINMGLIESYDIQAETLRQVRDEERNGIDARIKANNELKAVLEDQAETMTEQAQKVRDAAQAQFDLTKNDEDRIALIQAENELEAVKARVVGFMAEQKANDLALDKERLEIQKELGLIGKTEFDRQRAEAEQLLADQVRFINQEVQNEYERNRLIEEANRVHEEELTKINGEENRKRIETEEAVKQAKIDLAQQALGALSGLAKEGSEEAKAMAAGMAILDAYKAISATFANASANPSTILFPGYPFVQAAIAGLNAFNTVKKIYATDPSNPTTASAPNTGNRGQQSQAPAFNIVGANPQNQLAQALGEKEQKPVKAYVLSKEVTNQQALDRNIENNAKIG
jgi:hypothetical protein